MPKLKIKDKRHFQVLLAENGWTAKYLANSVGIGNGYLSTIVNGKKTIGSNSARKIAEKFNVDVTDIFFVSDVDKSYTNQKV